MTKTSATSDKVKPYTIRLPESVHRQLKVIAASEGRTMNDIIQRLIADYLKTKAGK